MKREILKSNAAFVAIGESPSWKAGPETGSLFALVQGCNISFNVERQSLKQLGSKKYIVNDVSRAPNVDLSLNYYLSPYLNNELLMGFNGHDEIDRPAFERIHNKNYNFYMFINNEENEDSLAQMKLDNPKDINYMNFSLMSFGDCYLSKYSLNFSLGQVPIVSTVFKSSNIKFESKIVEDISYEIVSGLYSWTEAKTHAEANGGILAIVDSNYKNNLIPRHEDPMWIGGWDYNQEGSWEWINGDLISNGYSNWASGQPNNSGNEDYLQRFGYSASLDSGLLLWNFDSVGTNSNPQNLFSFSLNTSDNSSVRVFWGDNSFDLLLTNQEVVSKSFTDQIFPKPEGELYKKWNDVKNNSQTHPESFYHVSGYILQRGGEEASRITPPSKHPLKNNNYSYLDLSKLYYQLSCGYVRGDIEGRNEYNPPVVVPHNSQFILQNLQVASIPLSKEDKPILQNLSIDIDFNRVDLYGLGNNHPYDRKLQYPIIAQISLSSLVSGFNSGFFNEIENNETGYDLDISFSSSNSNATGWYKFKNAKLNNFNFQTEINNIMNFNASFSVEIDDEDGFFIHRRMRKVYTFADKIDLWNKTIITWDNVNPPNPCGDLINVGGGF